MIHSTVTPKSQANGEQVACGRTLPHPSQCPLLDKIARAEEWNPGQGVERFLKISLLEKQARERKLVYSSKSVRKLSPSDSFEALEFYSHTVKIKRNRPIKSALHLQGKQPPSRSETTIQGFSQKSKSKLRLTADNSREHIKTQFCMTYHLWVPLNGRELKRQLSLFRRRVSRKFPEIHFIWIAEAQSNGNPHFHFFSDIPHTEENHSWLAAAWHEIAGNNSPEHLAVHRHQRNFIEWDMYNSGYLTKYLDKEKQKDIPPGFASFGRFWGSSYNLVPKVETVVDKDEIALFSSQTPEYVLRNLCRYVEKKNPRSTVRNTPQSRFVYGGAAIAKRLIEHKTKGKFTMRNETSTLRRLLFCEICKEPITPQQIGWEKQLICDWCRDDLYPHQESSDQQPPF